LPATCIHMYVRTRATCIHVARANC
jgi:hypothetical protein